MGPKECQGIGRQRDRTAWQARLWLPEDDSLTRDPLRRLLHVDSSVFEVDLGRPEAE
jgi:hypothetical protein